MHARLQATGSKQETAIISTGEKPRSKFSRRFNMTGSGMTQTDDPSGLTASSDKEHS